MHATASDRRLDALTRHHNRYYNSAIGRWLSEDPIGFEGGDVNLNRFVGQGDCTISDDTATTFEIAT